MVAEGERRGAEGEQRGTEVSVAAIVLAAGRATRMGGQKLLLSLGGRPLVQWAVDAALGSKASGTVVVVGHEAPRVAEVLAGRPVTVVVNSHYEQGLSTSLQAGVRATGGACDAAIFLLGDQPFVTSAVLDRLIERFAKTRKAVVRPLVAGRPANPVLMSAELFPEILGQRGDVGGREIVARHPGEICLVAVDDPRVGIDIDSVEDYEAARPAAVSRVDAAGRPIALVKGAGDLATGVALRLLRSGFAVVMTEIPRPTVVRRTVAFAEAVYEGRTVVEGVEGVRAEAADRIDDLLARGAVPVVVDPEAALLPRLRPALLVDAIVAKRNLGTRMGDAPAVVALGPGFVAGRDVHAVVETKRGHTLGRVIFQGEALSNTGIPGAVGGFSEERVLRAPCAGVFRGAREIGDQVSRDEVVGYVDGLPVPARLDGVLRGLLHPGLEVSPGFKLGDVDPRARREHCFVVSDKALAIAGGVLEAACTLLGGVRFLPSWAGRDEAG